MSVERPVHQGRPFRLLLHDLQETCTDPTHHTTTESETKDRWQNMITATVLYPNEPNTSFDNDYYMDKYMDKHIPMVGQRLAPPLNR